MGNLSTFYDTFYNAILNCWPMMTLFLVIIVVCRVSHILINNERIVLYNEIYGFIAIFYFLLLYYLLLSTESGSYGFNITPFKEMTRYPLGSRLFVYNVLGNIALFIPFGIFVSRYLKAKKITHILFVTIIISLTAELIQYKIGRAFDVDDIILNVVGAIIGFLLYIAVDTVRKHLPKFLQNNLVYNIFAILILMILVLLFGSIWGISLG